MSEISPTLEKKLREDLNLLRAEQLTGYSYERAWDIREIEAFLGEPRTMMTSEQIESSEREIKSEVARLVAASRG